MKQSPIAAKPTLKEVAQATKRLHKRLGGTEPFNVDSPYTEGTKWSGNQDMITYEFCLHDLAHFVCLEVSTPPLDKDIFKRKTAGLIEERFKHMPDFSADASELDALAVECQAARHLGHPLDEERLVVLSAKMNMKIIDPVLAWRMYRKIKEMCGSTGLGHMLWLEISKELRHKKVP